MSKNGLNKGQPYPPLRPAKDLPYQGPSYRSPRNSLEPGQIPKLPWWVYPPLGAPELYKWYCMYNPDTAVCKERNPDNKDKPEENDDCVKK